MKQLKNYKSPNRSESTTALVAVTNSAVAKKRTIDAEESSTPPAKKMKVFSKSKSDDDMKHIPSVNVTGTGIKCSIRVETSQLLKYSQNHKSRNSSTSMLTIQESKRVDQLKFSSQAKTAQLSSKSEFRSIECVQKTSLKEHEGKPQRIKEKKVRICASSEAISRYFTSINPKQRETSSGKISGRQEKTVVEMKSLQRSAC